ncbi:MAG: hypothetical protein ACXWW9_10270 [Actinomycetota bacterium]
MAELRVELPSVVTVLASSEICDGVGAPTDAMLLRLAPREVMLVGVLDVSDVRTSAGAACLVVDVSDAWVSLVLEGADAPEAFSRLSELELPSEGWVQGEVARTAAKVLVEPARITILVPAMLAAHVEERVRTDAAEVLAP